MGLYDRDYARDEDDGPEGFSTRSASVGPQTIVMRLVIINVAIWVIDLFVEGALRRQLLLNTNVLREPWRLYGLLSYAFVHSVDVQHLAFNMFGLYMFGRAIEQRLGAKEFLRFYLAAALCGGAVFLAHHLSLGTPASVLGASGAVNAVVILFALYYPNTPILLFFVIPAKMWVAAVLFVLFDLFGGVQTNVAHDVHLAGAGFALAYFFGRWNLSRLTSWGGASRVWSRRPRLSVFQEPTPAEIEAKVDAILQKISEQGEASLTKAERKTLEDASRRYQRRKP